jgi:curved DNA-binding protein CbpA
MIAENPYRILRAPWGATDAEIRDAYRNRARLLHPDKGGRLGDRARQRAVRRMQAVNRAYEVLRQPASREAIDKALRARRATRTLFAVVGASALIVLLTVIALRMPQTLGRAGLETLIEATKQRPRDAEAWDRRWRAEAARGMTAEASASLSRALALDPSSVELHEEHGRMAARTGDAATVLAETTWLRAHGYDGRADAIARQRENP